ncbi:MAG: hypothetical protein AB7U81_03455 [Thiohalomonadaceae bacterium]
MSATRRERQQGASLITAVFLITAMAVIAGVMMRLTANTQVTTAEEWLSAQALYAAESGIDWAAYKIADGTVGCAASDSGNVAVGDAWFRVSTGDCLNVGGRQVHTITSIGYAGGAPGNAAVQRRIIVQFMP